MLGVAELENAMHFPLIVFSQCSRSAGGLLRMGSCHTWKTVCVSILQRAIEAQREASWPESHRQWVAELGWEPSPLLAWKDGRKPEASDIACTGKFIGCSKVPMGSGGFENQLPQAKALILCRS